MAIRLETKHSMLRRCRGWDYRQPCIYMITLVLADRRSKALGRLALPRHDRELHDRNLALPRHAQDRNLALPRQVQDRPRQAQDRPRQAQDRPCQAQGGGACFVPGAAAPGLTAISGFTAHFSAIGNLFLLDSPSIIQVQCSRADFAYKRIEKAQSGRSEYRSSGRKIARDADGTPIAEKTTSQFEEKRDGLLAAAKHGAVLISPCISDGEREIARLAFAASLPVIALRNMGFSPLYKPGGKLFDKTANGKLLLLAPAAWPYCTAEKPMTRFDACVMNRLAQLIAGPGAAEINYTGMKPRDIERLVREAVAKNDNGENNASKNE